MTDIDYSCRRGETEVEMHIRNLEKFSEEHRGLFKELCKAAEEEE